MVRVSFGLAFEVSFKVTVTFRITVDLELWLFSDFSRDKITSCQFGKSFVSTSMKCK